MRMRFVKGSFEEVKKHPKVFEADTIHKGQWQQFFGNNNPLHIEIGMGKGQFIKTLARNNRDINYIGFEKFSSILIKALKDITEDDTNIHFYRFDASELEAVFEPGEVSRIYLNFSDPWHKERYAKHRLTHHKFFEKYYRLLPIGGLVEFKTDNRNLFDFTIDTLGEITHLFQIEQLTYDLHQSEYIEGNIMTEYEAKFHAMGHPIFKVIVSKKAI